MKNIVLIMCDQLRKDYLGAYGNPYVCTPNIDSLASEAYVFENNYVCNPICMPNRMSLFTGMYPHNHGMWTNGLMPSQQLPTIANTLHDAGYDTCSIGKLHFEPTDCFEHSPRGSREDHRVWEEIGDNIDWYGPYWGFDHVELTIGHATKPIAHYGKWYHEHGGNNDMAKAKLIAPFTFCPVTTMPEQLHDSTFIGERCADYIMKRTDSEKPFFLLASFPDPHHPFNPPLETARKYINAPIKTPIAEDDDLKTRPLHYSYHQNGAWHRAGVIKEVEGMTESERQKVKENMSLLQSFLKIDDPTSCSLIGGESSNARKKGSGHISNEERNERIRNTYAMIELIDKSVGRIVEALKKAGKYEDTIIVFTSDHGELMGEHGLWLKGPFFFDGLINVPLIICNHNHEARSNAYSSTIDIYPTLCSLAGVKTPSYIDGRTIINQNGSINSREQCLFEYRNGYFDHDNYSIGIVNENYKFIQYQDGQCELTDRKKDIEERINVADAEQYSDVLNSCKLTILKEVLNSGIKYPEQISNA